MNRLPELSYSPIMCKYEKWKFWFNPWQENHSIIRCTWSEWLQWETIYSIVQLWYSSLMRYWWPVSVSSPSAWQIAPHRHFLGSSYAYLVRMSVAFLSSLFDSIATPAQVIPIPSRGTAVCGSKLSKRNKTTTTTPIAKATALKAVAMISWIDFFFLS